MVLAQELPDVLDGVQLGRIGRQLEQTAPPAAAGSCRGWRGRTDKRRNPRRRSIAPTLRSAKVTLNRALITRARSTRRQRTTPSKVWSFANQLCYGRLLLWREPWFRSSCYAVAEPGNSFGVVA